VPTGAIQQHQAMIVGETGGGGREGQGHSLGIHPGQDKRAGVAIEGANAGQA